MIRKYIQGNNERGLEVINELEKLGAENTLYCEGIYNNNLYFITELNCIASVSKDSILGILIKESFEEIKLPEKFVSKETAIYTEMGICGCVGCIGRGEAKTCFSLKTLIGIDCQKEKIIFKKR